MEQRFETLKKKFSLPTLKELETMFEVSIKDDHLVLQSIRNETASKLYEISKTLEAMVFTHEGSDPEILYEFEMIKDDLKECYNLYKELNHLYFKALRLKHEHSKEKDVEYIKDLIKKWPSIESRLKAIFGKIENGWKNFQFSPNNLPETYHG